MSDGVYFLERVRLRCIEDGECLLWTGNKSESGHPKLPDGSGRRAVWAAAFGKVPAGKLVTVTCENVDCLAPKHLKLTDKAEVAARVGAKIEVRVKKSIASARIQRQRGKLDFDKVRAIRASGETCAELADRYGVHFTLISAVRLNKAWREAASPFAGLGARS